MQVIGRNEGSSSTSSSNNSNSLLVKRQQQQQQHLRQHGDGTTAAGGNHGNDDNQKRSRPRLPLLVHDCHNLRANCTKHLRFCKNHLQIVFVSVLIFAVISGAGIALSKVFSQHQDEELRDTAMALASESGEWFAKELDLAILPLFSMAQFATELDIFRGLPKQVSTLPFLVQSNSTNTSNSSTSSSTTTRNVTGVCDEPELVARYTSIAQAVKASAGLQGVLVNLQLAPHGVICLLHPMNNTEDFTNGTFLDSTSVWGMDLMNDAKMKYHARQQIKQKNNALGIVGPRVLAQCPTCGLYFIVRLVIHLDDDRDDGTEDDDSSMGDHLMWVDNLGFKRWGFATALINWEHLVQRSHMHSMFQERGMTFLLTRTDRVFNETTQSYDEQVQVLAQSDDFGTKPFRVAKALHTTNNEWVMTVEYSNSQEWEVIVMIISVFMAFCIAFLVFIVLIQKQLHMAMMGTNMAHQAKVEIERNMTAYFAHELRNPLSAVDSALQSMPDNLPQEAVELIHGMQLCSSFMATIMNNLLDVRKIEEGKMELKCNPLSVSMLLQNVRKMLLPVVRPGVELIVFCETTTSTSGVHNECNNDLVIGDEHRLKQILYNICYNACKYTSNGSITIYGGWEKIDNTSHATNSKPRMLRLECRDTGPGIPKQEQGDLFQRFTTRGGAPGSGLGLAISKQMVDLMQGSIYFESDPTVKPGTNCIVELPLPLCDDDQLLPDPQDDVAFNVNDGKNDPGINQDFSPAPFVEPLSILVVDDIKMNRAILKKRIQKCIAPNCTFQEAATGEQALMICCGFDDGNDAVDLDRDSPQSFDIIIVDQYMEEAGGILVGTDVVIAMRRSKLDAVIIGNSGNDLDDKFIAAGADLFWKKPLPSNSEIIRQLRSAIERRRTICLDSPPESPNYCDQEMIEV